MSLLEQGEQLRREGRFGEAINAFREVSASAASRILSETDPECLSRLHFVKAKADASVELIMEINGFVNVDLLNP